MPKELDCLRPNPWYVWVVDVRYRKGLSPQALANRDFWANGTTSAKRVVTEGLPRWSGKALMASIGADALGGIGTDILGEL